MRAAAVRIEPPFPTIDVCGTGGDGLHTLNISTAVGFVAAGGGLKVAKHGNRALSSKSGTADVLAELGVDVATSAERQLQALDEAGICFLFAPAHHGAMRHVSPIRAELGFRTIFNLLGPLTNPAGAQRQVVGVYSDRWVERLAEALAALGSERAWVVHGAGLDELTTTGETSVAEVRDGQVRLFTVTGRVEHHFTRRLYGLVAVIWRDETSTLTGDTIGLEEQVELRWTHRQTTAYVRGRNANLETDDRDNSFQLLEVGLRRDF